MNTCELQKPIYIAGTCSVSSREQALENASEALKRGILLVRECGYKPRTEPGKDPKDFFDGVYQIDNKEYLQWLAEVCNLGSIPALEVNGPKMTGDVLNALAKEAKTPRVLVWIGSRMQEHRDQIDIARLVAETDWAMLMVKNQMWRSEKHWRGIIGFVTEMGGVGNDRLIVCHRGFDPGTNEPRDPLALRNNPDHSMAMKIKSDLGVTMIEDASHIGGSKNNVFRIAREAMAYEEFGVRFDGLMAEVCKDPSTVKTDQEQHLTWEDFDVLRATIQNPLELASTRYP